MILKKSDKGTLVIWLQDALDISPDGDFGSKTEAAVKLFQENNGLKIDGEAGTNTLLALGLDLSPFYINGSLKTVEWLLPKSGMGFRTYNRDGNDQFGTVSTIGFLMEICKEWDEIYGVDAQIGNISRRRGGIHKPHESHKNGNQVDVRPFRYNVEYQGVTWQDAAYNRGLTEQFIRLVHKKVKGVSILFNDPELVKKGLCKKFTGHDNHLHISFPVSAYKLKTWQIEAMIKDSPRKAKAKIPEIKKVLKTIETAQEKEPEKVHEIPAQTSTQTQKIEAGNASVEVQTGTINEQNVTEDAEVEEPKPQGFLKKFGAGVTTIFGGTLLYDSVGKFAGVQLSAQAIYVLMFIIFIAFLGFCVWAVLDTLKKNKRTEIEAMANTSVTRKNIKWVKPE